MEPTQEREISEDHRDSCDDEAAGSENFIETLSRGWLGMCLEICPGVHVGVGILTCLEAYAWVTWVTSAAAGCEPNDEIPLRLALFLEAHHWL